MASGEKVVDFNDGHIVTTRYAYRRYFTSYPVIRAGGTVVIGSGIDFDTPSSWLPEFASTGSFDGDLDGDIFAATFTATPSAGTEYRHATMVARLGGSTPVVAVVDGDQPGSARSVAVDALGGGAARIALGVSASSSGPAHAELWRSSGPDLWSQEAVIAPPNWSPLADNGLFGDRVGLDGDLLVVASRVVSSSTTLNPTGVLRSGYLVGYERTTGGWTAAHSLDPTFEPFEAGASLRLPQGKIFVSGGHVAVSVFSDRTAAPTAYYDTWRFDRPA